MIGYFSRDAYWLYDPGSQWIFCSCDIIFKEETGHKILLAMSETPSKAEVNEQVSLDASVTADVPLSTSTPTVVPPAAPTAPIVKLRHLICTQRPIQAILNSEASELTIAEAQQSDKDWQQMDQPLPMP